MNRRERLTATMEGRPVDRPAVCFYELNGFTQDPGNKDPFNIFSDPSWKPLLDLAREESDVIILSGVGLTDGVRWSETNRMRAEGMIKNETFLSEGSRFSRTSIRAGNRTLSAFTRRDPDVDTVWTLEHLVKDVDDFKAWLDLPFSDFDVDVEVSGFLEFEKKVGDAGIVGLDFADPICRVAPLFDMGEYTIMAMTERKLFHKALQKSAKYLYKMAEAVAKALPGRLWRICGPEYASPPYLPPSLFREYVLEYDRPLVETIQKHGGHARIHSHGRLHDILDIIVETGCMALDPIEPPPQGDVELSYVREKYGDKLTLFGNIEITDIENLSQSEFEKKIAKALREGTAGKGRGFVLMPSACPIGRKLSPNTVKNYELMVSMAKNF